MPTQQEKRLRSLMRAGRNHALARTPSSSSFSLSLFVPLVRASSSLLLPHGPRFCFLKRTSLSLIFCVLLVVVGEREREREVKESVSPLHRRPLEGLRAAHSAAPPLVRALARADPRASVVAALLSPRAVGRDDLHDGARRGTVLVLGRVPAGSSLSSGLLLRKGPSRGGRGGTGRTARRCAGRGGSAGRGPLSRGGRAGGRSGGRRGGRG